MGIKLLICSALALCLNYSLAGQVNELIYINLAGLDLDADLEDKEAVNQKVKDLARFAQPGALIFASNGARPVYYIVPSHGWVEEEKEFKRWEDKFFSIEWLLPSPDNDLDSVFKIISLNRGLKKDAEVSFIFHHEIVLREEVVNLVDWIFLSVNSRKGYEKVAFRAYITKGTTHGEKIREQLRDEVFISELAY